MPARGEREKRETHAEDPGRAESYDVEANLAFVLFHVVPCCFLCEVLINAIKVTLWFEGTGMEDETYLGRKVKLDWASDFASFLGHEFSGVGVPVFLGVDVPGRLGLPSRGVGRGDDYSLD